MKNTLKVLFVAAVASAFAMGCGSSSSGSSGTTLNTTQMSVFSQEMSSAVSGGIASSGAFTTNVQVPDHHHHALGHEQPFTTSSASATVNCAAGGTSTVTGSLTYTVGGSTLNISSLTFTVAFNDCQHVGTDGVTYTINSPSGPLAVAASGSFTSSGGEVSGTLSMTESGTIDVTGTNLSADCSIDVSVSDTETNNSSSVTVTGTACGNTVNKTFSF